MQEIVDQVLEVRGTQPRGEEVAQPSFKPPRQLPPASPPRDGSPLVGGGAC